MSVLDGTETPLTEGEAARKESLRVLSLAAGLGDKDERLTDLLADFSTGFATGWAMAVGDYFQDSLDIRQTEKVSRGVKSRLWTQGGCFTFSAGDTVYDTPNAYGVWEVALQNIGIAYQVLSGTPSTPKKEVDLFRKIAFFEGSLKGNNPRANVARRTEVLNAISTDWADLDTIKNRVKNITDKGVSSELLYLLCEFEAVEKRTEIVAVRIPGTVRFQVMIPNRDRSGLMIMEERVMSQDDFVGLLITGEPLSTS